MVFFYEIHGQFVRSWSGGFLIYSFVLFQLAKPFWAFFHDLITLHEKHFTMNTFKLFSFFSWCCISGFWAWICKCKVLYSIWSFVPSPGMPESYLDMLLIREWLRLMMLWAKCVPEETADTHINAIHTKLAS